MTIAMLMRNTYRAASRLLPPLPSGERAG
jgi:hypothetical protein